MHSKTKIEVPLAAVEPHATRGRGRAVARYAPAVARVLLGLLFLFAGLNGFFNFVPPPDEPMPEGAMAFAGALMKTGYMFPLIKGTEALVGLLLLVNRFVPLALVVIAPVIVNIVAFHVILAPEGSVTAIVVLALEVYLAWAYRHAFLPLVASRSHPAL